MPELKRRTFLASMASIPLGGILPWRDTPLLSQTAAASLAGPIKEDEYWAAPRADFEERRKLYLEFCSTHARLGRNGIFSQIARLDLGKEPVEEEILREALDFVATGRDCTDFTIGAFVRILYLYRDSPLVPAHLLEEIESSVLDFKYWWQEPGRDGRCYHTENHQIIFHMGELLAGQLFSDRKFSNDGRTGREHVEHALPLIRRWIDFRVKFGFSEWLSNCYFDHDLMALVNLRDFAEAPDVRAKAEMLVDILLFEIALHSFRGVFGSTHGRTTSKMIKSGWGEHTASISKLIFGMGVFNEPDSLGTVSLATSDYRCPSLIVQVAQDLVTPILCKERHSLDIEDAPKYGLSYSKVEDGHLYWGIQDYIHPAILELSRGMSEAYGVRQFEDYQQYADQYEAQIREHGKIVDPDLCNKALTEVNIQTYRTKDYLLSCAQDYRPGKPGYQQHIWQASFGIDTPVFTNHPGADKEGGRPDYWAGNGIMPRAAQHRNVLICIHRIPSDDPFPFSHAFFPREEFAEVQEENSWVFGRVGEGYVALYSEHPAWWMNRVEGEPENELRVDSASNIWVCELGSKTESGGFSDFVKAVAAAQISCQEDSVEYESPSLGKVKFAWEGPLRIAEKPVPLDGYKRFDNPYCQSEFASREVVIQREEEKLVLDFEEGKRTVS
jgi:hypothetical protein